MMDWSLDETRGSEGAKLTRAKEPYNSRRTLKGEEHNGNALVFAQVRDRFAA